MRINDIITIAILSAILPATLTAANDVDSEQIKKVLLDGIPVQNRAPEFAVWTITFDDHSGSQEEGKARARSPRKISSIVVTKSKDTYCEQIHYGDKSKLEIWTVGDLRIQPDVSGRLCIYPANSMNASAEGNSDDTFNTDGVLAFTKTDFPDFQWLTKHNFVGLQQSKSSANLVFQSATNTCFTGVGVTSSKVTALVDSQSRLPSEITCKEWTMHFEFGALPGNMLALPPAVQELLNQRDQQLKNSLKRNPSI